MVSKSISNYVNGHNIDRTSVIPSFLVSRFVSGSETYVQVYSLQLRGSNEGV